MSEEIERKAEHAAQSPAAKPLQDSYESPELYRIGKANELLRGSGRHKNDDTGSAGFTVG